MKVSKTTCVLLMLAAAGCAATPAAAPNGHDAVACREVAQIVDYLNILDGSDSAEYDDAVSSIGDLDVADASREIRDAVWRLQDAFNASPGGSDIADITEAENTLSELCVKRGGAPIG